MNKTEHLLVILGEEAAEVAHRVSKALRFGLGDIDPQRHETARRVLERELGDLMAVAEILDLKIHDEDKAAKREKLKKYMAYAKAVGTLEDRES
jgi:NTP pyrophosphatase (non-canonical NTP hydrolase)